MKTIKTYQCECGEDFYEDDVNCLNCRKPIDKSKLKDEEVADIKYLTHDEEQKNAEYNAIHEVKDSVEEIPQMKGTLEALDKLTIRPL